MTIKICTVHPGSLILGSVFIGLEILLVFFFCPETAYRRADDLNLDLGTHIHSPHLDKVKVDIQTEDPPWTLLELLRPWRGVESDDNLFKIIVRPIPLLLFPQVLYAFIIGLSSAWLSVLLGIIALIFGGPPYNLSVSRLGMLGIGGLIASLLGFVAAPLNDWLCKYLSRRNNGTYEPEVNLFEKFLNAVSSRNDGLHLPIRYDWIFWVWNHAALSTSVDDSICVSLHHRLRAFVPQHRDFCIRYRLSARSRC